MSETTTKRNYVRHEDDRFIDAVTIDTSPRWKESELSGDEWRFSAHVRFWRKGVEVAFKSFRDIPTAAAWLAFGAMTVMEDLPLDQYRLVESATERLCANPGCSNAGTITYRILKDWCVGGGNCGQEKPTYGREEFIRFCERHKHRGDCGLKDADVNYELVPEEE